jgi:hypothetical protein
MPTASPAAPPVDLKLLRQLLWLYMALWVFEGALRKWILPGLAAPLLIIRDPVLILIYVLAYSKGVFPTHAFIGWIAGVGALSMLVSLAATSIPLAVQIYGFRANFLHLPLVFVLAAVFDLKDIRAIGKWSFLLALPMGALVTLQFLSPAGAWINTGAGGEGGMIESAFGRIRPSGTFSFTNGLSGFSLLVTAFFLHHMLETRIYPRLLWLATAPVILVLIALSGSRSAVGQVGLTLATVIFICLVQGRYWQSSIKLLILAGLAIVALGSFAVFKDGLDVFSSRFGAEGGVKTGFFDRFFNTFAIPFMLAGEAPLGGMGLGLGTNVGASLLTGRRDFLVAEGEFARVMLESGPVAGSLYLLLRLALTIYLGSLALTSLRTRSNTLPLLLFSTCFVDMIQGQFAQPTALGFTTIAAGLSLAANRVSAETGPAPPVGIAPAAPTALPRGRSRYAEQMHGDDAPPLEEAPAPSPAANQTPVRE